MSQTPATAVASTDGETDTDFEEEFALLEDDAAVVETAARHQQDIGMSPSAITVITRQDIATSGADNLGDLLRLVPGIAVATDTPFYTAVSGRMPNSNENQHYLVLIDGREANDNLAGTTMFMAQPIFLEDIERIEVINGPGSTLYGADALVGVISITTRALPEKNSAWAQIAAGEPGAHLLAGRASLVEDKWGLSVSGGLDYSGSYSNARRPGRRAEKARLMLQGKPGRELNLLFDGGFSHGRGDLASMLGRLNYEIFIWQTRLSLQASSIKANLYYMGEFLKGGIDRDIYLAKSHLASFINPEFQTHIVDGELQWDLPSFWQPLLLISGARIRGSWLSSDQVLGEGYDDLSSPDYHRQGVNWSGLRAGGFVHGELRAMEWLTLTAGARLDYDTATGPFLSPRLTAVMQPWSGHYFRLGAARSFRTPSFQETGVHLAVEFPPGSPLQGSDQQNFLEFMSRSIGNPDLENEKLWALEAGYRLRLLDGKLWTDIETYANHVTDLSDFTSKLVTTSEGFPDLDRSALLFEVSDEDYWIWGMELSLRYQPSDEWLLQAAWSHREVIGKSSGPQNLVLAGGRYLGDSGLLGSLYISTRNGSEDHQVESPEGILAKPLSQHLPTAALVLARLGYRFGEDSGGQLEIGARLYLPINLENGNFYYQGRGGYMGANGEVYGGSRLGRRFSVYIEGSL